MPVPARLLDLLSGLRQADNRSSLHQRGRGSQGTQDSGGESCEKEAARREKGPGGCCSNQKPVISSKYGSELSSNLQTCTALASCEKACQKAGCLSQEESGGREGTLKTAHAPSLDVGVRHPSPLPTSGSRESQETA